MSKIVYSPGAIIGERPLNLNPVFDAEQDGSVARQLRASGYYAGVLAAKSVLEEHFDTQPEIIAQLDEVFITSTEQGQKE